jgi:hypothetical protein
MTRGELLDLVIEQTGLGAEDAMRVVSELWGAERAYTPAGIDYAVEKLGLKSEPKAPATPAPHMTMDPAQVLLEVNRVLPRMIPLQPDGVHAEGIVHVPRIGRAPKDSVFYDESLRAQIEALPEEIRVLIGSVDVFAGAVTFTLYDEANDIDHRIGPIDLTHFTTADEFKSAIDTLLSRLPRVLAADFN